MLPAWVEIAVLVSSQWSELVAEELALLFPAGLAFGAPSLASDPVPEGCELVRAFASAGSLASLRERAEAALAALAARADAPELARAQVRVRKLPAEDFARSWEKGWKAFRIGRLCFVRPGAKRGLRTGDVRIELEPGGAFGTGRHPTTRALLLGLQERIEGGARVLDAGTGNGVLAVAALVLGAERAVAFDNDPNALPYADELARKNRVRARLQLRQGGFEVLGERDVAFDAVLANLYADLIQTHAGELARRLRPGGWFGFSGCHRDRRAQTEAALELAGLEVQARRSRGRWDTYLGLRPI